MQRLHALLLLPCVLGIACSSNEGSGTGPARGRETGSGGTASTGGKPGTGGVIASAGGSTPGSGGQEQTARLEAKLSTASNCDEVFENIRSRIRARMEDYYATTAARIRENEPGGCGQDAAAGPSSASESGPNSISTTNNQVANVDEADVVKTDGRYLYLATGNALTVVHAWPAAEARKVATVPFSGAVKKLLLDGDRVIVYSSAVRSSSESGYVGRDCTYGYDCDFSGDGQPTRLTLLDVADRTAPKVIRTIDFAGSLVAARRIGHLVHQVTTVPGLTVPGLEWPSVHIPCNGSLTTEQQEAALQRLAEARKANDARIAEATFADVVGVKEAGAAVGTEDCRDYFLDGAGDGSSVTSLSSLDTRASTGLHIANVLSPSGAVYATADALYMAVIHRRGSARGGYDSASGSEVSAVHRFVLGDAIDDTRYAGSGLVPGHVLNQFSMDESDGRLRIATSIGRVPDPGVESAVTVLAPDASGLTIEGRVSGIAPSEDIRSVRFDGDRAYVVTFKKTDPLFVLDLANPAKPAILGELKIPGFSTYLHRLDSEHLLALGYEADEQGGFAYFNGIQLQVFDVSDPTAPALASKKVFGTRGSSSAALTDHLAFTFLPDRGLLALPMNICEGGGNGAFGSFSFGGIVALQVDAARGISETGRVSVPVSNSESVCQSWWTNSTSAVKRTIVMDQALYGITASDLRVWNLADLAQPATVVPL